MHLADALSKATYIAFKLQFYILSALAFPGNWTHDLSVASAMLYHLSNRKAQQGVRKAAVLVLSLVVLHTVFVIDMIPRHSLLRIDDGQISKIWTMPM